MQHASGRGQLYTGGRDGVIKVWDCKTPKNQANAASGNAECLADIEYPNPDSSDNAPGTEYEEAMDVDEKMLKLETSISSAPLTHDIPLRMYGTESSKSYNVHFDWINDLKLVNNDRHIVSASSDLSLKLLDLDSEDNNVQRFLNVHTDYIQKLSSMPSQNIVVSGGLDGMIVTWDLETLKPVSQFYNLSCDGVSDFTSIYALSNDNKNLISVGGPDSLINIYDQRISSSGGSNLIWKLVGHQDTVRCLLMNSHYLLSGSSDTSVKLWDLRNFSIYKSFEYHDDAVWNLCTASSSDPGMQTSTISDFKEFYSGDKAGNIIKTDLNYLSTHSSYDEQDPYGRNSFSATDFAAIDEKIGVCTLVAKVDHPVVALCAESETSLFVSTYSSLDRYYIPQTRQLSKYQYLRTCSDYAEAFCAMMDDEVSSGLDLAGTDHSELDLDFYDIVSHLSIDLNNKELQSALASNLAGKAQTAAGVVSDGIEGNIEHLSLFLDVNGGPSGEYVNVYKDQDRASMGEIILDPFVDNTPVEILLYPVSASSIVTIPFNKQAFQTFPITARSVIAKRMLNNKRQLFALYCNGDIVMWDIVVGKELKRIASGNDTHLSAEEIRMYQKKLDDVFEEHQTKDTLNNWCEVDIRAGKLLVSLVESSFNNVEVYYDDLLADYPFLDINDTSATKMKKIRASADDRFWISRILLNSIFNNYALFEVEADKNLRETLKAITKNPEQYAPSSSESALNTNDEPSRRRKLFSRMSSKSVNTVKVPMSTSASVASNISDMTLDLNQLDDISCVIPNNLTNDCILKVLLFNKHYYREFYGSQGAKKTVQSMLKLYSNDLFNEEEDYEHRPLIAPEHFPPNLTFFVFELSPELGNFRDICSFTMEEINSFNASNYLSKAPLVNELRLSLPRWIGKTILQNKFPPKELPKVAFQLFEVDYNTLPSDRTIGGKAQKKIKKLPMLESAIKLTSHSMLRVNKILMFVVEKFGSKTTEMKNKKRAVEWLALECRGVELDSTMTLQTIKTKIWKSSADVELHFRRKFDE